MRMEQVIADHRLMLMAIVERAPSVRQGCQRAGIHHSTYYQWRRRIDAEGRDGLVPRRGRVRHRSPARMRLEAEVVALALVNPPWGPRRLFFELRKRQVDVGSASQVWRILCAHSLNTRSRRYRLMATARGVNHPDNTISHRRGAQRTMGRLHAKEPGDLVQLDCFHIGSLKEARLGPTKKPGVVWQYTAIDVASSFTWAELHTTAHNPSATHTSALAMRVADDLSRWGWEWKAATTDRGNEFVAARFGDTLKQLGVEHRLIAPGRPQSNGKVEQVQNTILQECWKPAFVSYVEPSITGLREDLDWFLNDYNWDRPHGGEWNNGTPPGHIINPNTGNQP